MLIDMQLSPHPGLEALTDAFVLVDAEGRVAYWNAAAERRFGVPRAEAARRAVTDVLGRACEGGLAGALASARTGETVRFLDTLPGAARPGPVSVTASPVEGGGAALHFHDASQERRLDEQYSRLLESLRQGFVAVGADWRIVYLNPSAERLLGVSRGRAVGARLDERFPDAPDALFDALRATMRDGEARHVESVRPSGRVFRGRCYDAWTYPLSGGGISILFDDVTDRLLRERELARLAAEAEEASRAKSRFFAAVSHELRTPLNAIVGYTHLLATETFGPLPADGVRAAERAGICAEHLARLVDDVLLLTTTELLRLPVHPSPVRAETLLPVVLAPLRLQAEAKGLDFELAFPEPPPMLRTDPERFRQLVLALVSNAVKFTARGGVRVEVRPVLADAAGGGHDVPALEVAVSDTGPGIRAEDHARIFEAFEQLGDPARSDSMTRGTGLGLTVARQLATLLQGTLALRSAPGEGTTFRLRLPLEPGRALA